MNSDDVNNERFAPSADWVAKVEMLMEEFKKGLLCYETEEDCRNDYVNLSLRLVPQGVGSAVRSGNIMGFSANWAAESVQSLAELMAQEGEGNVVTEEDDKLGVWYEKQ